MININIYDFDKTLYDGDSSIDFFLYSMKNYPSLWKFIPKILLSLILYKGRIISKVKFKEIFFSFTKKLINLDKTLELFWINCSNKIKKLDLNIPLKNSINLVISASPEFLIYPVQKYLPNFQILGTQFDLKSSKIIGLNCFGYEKVNRLNNHLGLNYKIINFYSDSLSDLPLAKLSQNAYLVNKNKISLWPF